MISLLSGDSKALSARTERLSTEWEWQRAGSTVSCVAVACADFEGSGLVWRRCVKSLFCLLARRWHSVLLEGQDASVCPGRGMLMALRHMQEKRPVWHGEGRQSSYCHRHRYPRQTT